MVAISVRGGHTYQAHKDILTKDSAYFERALNGHFIESATQQLDLDDISSSEFAFYLTTVYKTVLEPGLMQVPPEDSNVRSHVKYEFEEILGLWKLADRFLNAKVMDLAAEALNCRLAWTTNPQLLQRAYMNLRWEEIERHVQTFQRCFRKCEEEGLPFGDEFVTAMGNWPPLVFAGFVKDLDEDFAIAAAKQFALRMAEKLRPPDEDARRRANLDARGVQD